MGTRITHLPPSYKPLSPFQALDVGFKGCCMCFCDVEVTSSLLLCGVIFLPDVLEVYSRASQHKHTLCLLCILDYHTYTHRVSYRLAAVSQPHSQSLQSHHATVDLFHLKCVPCWLLGLTACLFWKCSWGRSIIPPEEEVFSFKVCIQFCPSHLCSISLFYLSEFVPPTSPKEAVSYWWVGHK